MDDERSSSSVAEPEPPEETAAEAFARLDGRIALMIRAVEHMAAERLNIEIPDYSPTLEKTNAHLANIHKRMKAIEDAPALGMTPEDMGARIAAAASEARREDHTALAEARKQHDAAAYDLRTLLGTARAIAGQRRHLLWAAGGGLVAGMLIWSILPGVALRTLPASWHMPESMAAHIVGEPSLWDAGSRLMQAGNPGAWQAIVAAAEMRRDNREIIDACEQRAHCLVRNAPLSK